MYQCPKDGKWIICPHFDCMDCEESVKTETYDGDLIVLRPESCIKIEYETALKEVGNYGPVN